MGKAVEIQSAGGNTCRWMFDFFHVQNVLEARQLIPMPLVTLSQHATTEPALQDEPLVGLGSADAATAMERTLMMVVYCMLLVLW